MDTLNEEQQKAFDLATLNVLAGKSGYTVIEGYAGVGKTFCTARILKYLAELGKKVLVTAPNHKALKVLRNASKAICTESEYSNLSFRTLHSAFGLRPKVQSDGTRIFVRDYTINPIPMDSYKVLFVDEVSMLEDRLFDNIEEEVRRRGISVVFVGDPEQIPPIGQDSSKPCSQVYRKDYGMEVVSLRTIVRQAADNPIIQKSVEVRENKDKVRSFSDRVTHTIRTPFGYTGVTFLDKSESLEPLLTELFACKQFDEDPDYAKVVAWRNDTVDRINDIIRRLRYGSAASSRLVVGEMLIADEPIQDEVTRRVLFNTNEEMEVLELVQGVEKINEGIESEIRLKYYHAVVLDLNHSEKTTKRIRVIHEESIEDYKYIIETLRKTALAYPAGSWQASGAWKEFYSFQELFAQVKYNYALTGHKAQGSTYDNCVVLEWDINANRKLSERNRIKYTACTRPRKMLYVVG